MNHWKEIFTCLTIILLSVLMPGNVHGQILNDDCQFAFPLPTPNNYCSEDAQFTNVGATSDPIFPNGCISLLWENGVWFSVVPKEPAMLIRVFGSGNGGTMMNPKVVVFDKCGSFLQCSPGKTVGNEELLIADLNIGQTYFIMIESSRNGEGTFKICIDDFVPAPSPESDCPEGVTLCDKSPFKVESLTTAGNLTNEVDPTSCIQEEFASAWYKWTCDQSGPLTFTLTPNDFQGRNVISDDLDFIIYELPNGIDNCVGKRKVRCMAAGANGTNGGQAPLSSWIECNGQTGLQEGDLDIDEDSGCRENNDNNWLRPLDMVAGRSYALLVNNFSRSGLGFSIEFGGTGTFLGPKVDFEIDAVQAFECDKTITFTEKSESLTDPITKYSWNFGGRSNPSRSNSQGPIDVVYAGFGDKTAALTVETSRGCSVTKIIDFYVEACCKDTSTLSVGGRAIDARCFGIKDGRIIAQGFSGNGDYNFSIDGVNFQANPQFNNLKPGTYNIMIYDLKGCRDTLFDVAVKEPDPITIDAGPDQTINLGDTTVMNGSYTVPFQLDSMFWEPRADFAINGIVDPGVFPKTTTTYTYTVVDGNGCTKSDQITIRVEKSYNIYYPNVFSPALNGFDVSENNFFNIWTTRGVKYVELLEVYDRWGNLMYKDRDIKVESDPGNLITSSKAHGWDGTFNNKKVNPGVYAWRARVRFIDDFVKNFAGDITIIR